MYSAISARKLFHWKFFYQLYIKLSRAKSFFRLRNYVSDSVRKMTS